MEARDEEPEPVPAGGDEEGPGERKASPAGKGLPAVLALLTGLLLAVPLGAASLVLGAGPELMGDEDGGEVRVVTSLQCHEPLANMTNSGCFSNLTATVQYGTGTPEVVHLLSASQWYDARINLSQARATLRLHADQGEWTREVWVPEGQVLDMMIRVDDPAESLTVEGRQAGLAVLIGGGGLLGATLFVAAAVWLFTGGWRAANITHMAMTLGLIISAVLAVYALFTASLGIGVAALVGWFWWIRSMTGKWIDGVG